MIASGVGLDIFVSYTVILNHFFEYLVSNKLSYPHTTQGYDFTLIYCLNEARRILFFSAQQADYRYPTLSVYCYWSVSTFILL